MASMTAGNLALVQAELDKILELARRNQYQLTPGSYTALYQAYTATAITIP